LEPTGATGVGDESNGVLPWINEFVLPQLSPGYVILTPDEVCPRFQKYDDPTSGGYCVAWSTLLLHTRLVNPEYFTVECQDLLFSRHSSTELLGLIRRYINWMDHLTPEIKATEFPKAFSVRQQQFMQT
jgi:hypothetical protein